MHRRTSSGLGIRSFRSRVGCVLIGQGRAARDERGRELRRGAGGFVVGWVGTWSTPGPLREEVDPIPELAAVLAQLGALLVEAQDPEAILPRVMELAKIAVPECDAAGITLVSDGKPTTAAATDQRTLAVDEAQYQAGDGPCLHAYRTGSVVKATAEEACRRWPDFAAVAPDRGVNSFLAAPLVVKGESTGSLNLYSGEWHGFADVDDEVVAQFAGLSAAILLTAQRFHQTQQVADQLHQAMSSRAAIEQAKGALMATYAVDADAAFELLRRQSQHENLKLRVLAEQIVDTATSGRPLQLRSPRSHPSPT